jgi:hypothetical protein
MSSSQTAEQNNDHDDNDAAQSLLGADDTGSYNDSNHVTPCVADYADHLETCLQVMATVGLQSNTLLLDNGLTACVISDGSIQHGIHMVNRHMHVHCKAGV